MGSENLKLHKGTICGLPGSGHRAGCENNSKIHVASALTEASGKKDALVLFHLRGSFW